MLRRQKRFVDVTAIPGQVQVESGAVWLFMDSHECSVKIGRAELVPLRKYHFN